MSEETPKQSSRSAEHLRSHYEIEKELASKLRDAPKAQRLGLYQTVYDELYSRVPDHPMLRRKATPEETTAQVKQQMGFLEQFIRPDMNVLEIGSGDCALSFALAPRVRKVHGLEVSRVIAAHSTIPANFELVLSDGTSVPVAKNSIDLAYSNQLMEHLHPDDAKEQLQNIYHALKPGGMYICLTPHRLQGPTDISQLYDDVAAGLHLKEYTYKELRGLFAEAGFAKTAAFVTKSDRPYRVSMGVMRAFETVAMGLFGWQSFKARQNWIRYKPFTVFHQGISIVGYRT